MPSAGVACFLCAGHTSTAGLICKNDRILCRSPFEGLEQEIPHLVLKETLFSILTDRGEREGRMNVDQPVNRKVPSRPMASRSCRVHFTTISQVMICLWPQGKVIEWSS